MVNTHKNRIYKPDHTTFGGIIYPSDFDSNFADKNIASRIARDERFDEQCRKNISLRKMRRN